MTDGGVVQSECSLLTTAVISNEHYTSINWMTGPSYLPILEITSETHNLDTRPRILLDGVVSVCIPSERRRHFGNTDCPLALRHLRKSSTVTAFLPCVPPSGVQVSEIAQHEAQEWQPANNKDLGMVSHDLHRKLGNGLCLVPAQLMDFLKVLQETGWKKLRLNFIYICF
ncbi:hypothetical protein CDAR_208721 [Caerostris darwini]|uniref:Uncharacterized protein n=1 Tax=Caerostris darwini TaxID=1538125 RepID=A0AAV4VRI5_9ARAC|nr:hypothetical protein CDAR_208721 [Caerostris darwini]